MIPKGLETPVEKVSSIGSSPEATIKPVKPENSPVTPTPEFIETQQSTKGTSSAKDQNDSKAAPAPTKTITASKEKVVDKSKGRPALHSLQNSHDKLTTIADSEEEEFIEKVETVHEPNI
jgi:hypothetical protein